MRLLLAFLLLFPALVHANDWQALDRPGVMAIMRHAIAPGGGDPAGFALGDCATQRNLDAQGRAQARAIGAAFRDRGITFDRVLTSQWCRTRDTAELLGLGPIEPAPPLNSFFDDRSTAAAQTAATRAIIDAAGGRLMLVTHQVNISALLGRSTRSGEVVLFEKSGTGLAVVGTILITP